MHYFAQVNCPVEWGFVSRRSYSDPFNEVQLDVVFTAPDGSEQRVPAFWAGEQEWRVRFAPSQVGDYRWRTICSDAANASLHGVEGTLTAVPYEGNNPLFRRGRLQVSADGRYLQHRDGTPFLWLGDTWWMGLCKRLRFPGDFAVLTADRVQKGFTYGANGIWQVNTREKPYGPSPHGMAWGDTPWEEAYQLPGSAQLGMAKRLLERYEWWRIEPHPEWVEPHWSEQNYFLPFAAGIPGELRLIYVPAYQWRVTVKSLERGMSYRAFLFDPATGQEMSLGEARGDEQGDWTTPILPKFQDWLLILESRQR
jgi:hypothetical protein